MKPQLPDPKPQDPNPEPQEPQNPPALPFVYRPFVYRTPHDTPADSDGPQRRSTDEPPAPARHPR